MDTINRKDHPDAFIQLCREQGYDYRTVVHHFVKDAIGIYRPVFWCEIETDNSKVPQ